MVVGWHVTTPTDGRGRPRGRRPGEKTTADIWWRQGIDDVDFGEEADLRKLSYYPSAEDEAEGRARMEALDPAWMKLPGLTEEETFQLDVSGYLRVPGVLSAEEAAAVSLDGVGGDPLASHPSLQRYLTAMCGDDYRQDTRIGLLQPPAEGNAIPLTAPAQADAVWGKEFFATNWGSPGLAVFRGVRVTWSLGSAPAEVALVPASHQNAVETPPCVLSGENHLGASVRVTLAPGDLLLSASTVLFGAAPAPTEARLASCEYVCATSYPVAGYDCAEPTPDWVNELTPTQRGILIRETGEPLGDAPPPPSIHGREFSGAEEAGIDLKELWFFDLTGYLVLPKVMDDAWVAAAQEAYDHVSADEEEVLVAVAGVGGPTNVFVTRGEAHEGGLTAGLPLEDERCSPRLRGGNGAGGGKIREDLYGLPDPWNAPFRRMIAHPQVHRRLEWMLGPDYREGTNPMGMCQAPGACGQAMHGRPYPFQMGERWNGRSGVPGNSYDFREGRVVCGQINAGWQLADVGPDDGGFLIIPGSQRGHFPLPRNRLLSMDLPTIQQPTMQKGDVVLFLGGSVVHGGAAWRGAGERRTVIQFYGPRRGSMPSSKLGYKAMYPRL